LCFEPRHERKRAPEVRENNYCGFWRQIAEETIAPSSPSHRILAALALSWGGVARSCVEVADWIGVEFGARPSNNDTGRLLEHLESMGRVLVAAGDLRGMLTWSGRLARILADKPSGGLVRFSISAGAREMLAGKYPAWMTEQDMKNARAMAAAREGGAL
jgi:hypothetical protein